MNGMPFDLALIDALRHLEVVERCDPAQLAEVTIPLATSMARAPSSWAGDAIGLDEAHRITTGHPDVTVAVLDTGCSPTIRSTPTAWSAASTSSTSSTTPIQFFADKLDADPDPTDPGVGHGSHVTGIIVAKGRRMLDGVAPGCRVLPVRVLGALRQGERLIGAGLVDNINAGIRYAVEQGADVINMSLGIQHEGGGLPHVDVIRAALAEGVSVVAAAGNDGTSTLYYPGALPGVIAVGAIDQDGQVAHYSTWGDQVDLVAPGTEIYSTWLRRRLRVRHRHVAGDTVRRRCAGAVPEPRQGDRHAAQPGAARRDPARHLRPGGPPLQGPPRRLRPAQPPRRARPHPVPPRQPQVHPRRPARQPDDHSQSRRWPDRPRSTRAPWQPPSTLAATTTAPSGGVPSRSRRLLASARSWWWRRSRPWRTSARSSSARSKTPSRTTASPSRSTRLRDRLTKLALGDTERLLLSTPGVTEKLFYKAIEEELEDYDSDRFKDFLAEMFRNQGGKGARRHRVDAVRLDGWLDPRHGPPGAP